MARRGIERFLDSERNPWKYVWRCAVHGHDYTDGACCRCGVLAGGSMSSSGEGTNDGR